MKTVIQDVHLIDGTGREFSHASVMIEGSMIMRISDHPIDGDCIINGTGKTLIPGLIDAHVHLGFGGFDDENSDAQCGALCLQQLLLCFKYGITTVRNMSTKNNIDIQIRDFIDGSNLICPRLIACGEGISITGGHGWKFNHECDTVDEALKAARIQIKLGADLVKLFATGGMGTKNSIPNCPQLTEEQMRAVVNEANRTGRLTAAHCTGNEGAQNAIRAGVRSIEHAQLDEPTAKLMKEFGTYYCPTIITRYNIIHTDDPKYQWMRKKAKPGDLERKQRAIELCLRYNIPICASTDATGNGLTDIGPSLAKELALYVEYGLTPMEAIQTATKTASEMCMIDNEVGTIEVGKIADMVMLDENPLECIEGLSAVALTFRKGEVVFRS